MKKCGFVAFIGRPNVGKSSILNAIFAQKISIATPKAQTTQKHIQAIKNTSKAQMIFVDTPGIHIGEKRRLNKVLNKSALAQISQVDVVVFVLDRGRITPDEEYIIQHLKLIKKPLIVLFNKLDLLPSSTHLLPLVQDMQRRLTKLQLK